MAIFYILLHLALYIHLTHSHPIRGWLPISPLHTPEDDKAKPGPTSGVPPGTDRLTGEFNLNGYQLIPPDPRNMSTRDPTAPIQLRGCGHVEADYILNDIADAITLAENAITHIHPSNPYFAAVFGDRPASGSAPTDAQIANRYRQLTRILQKDEAGEKEKKRAIVFDCSENFKRTGMAEVVDALSLNSPPTIRLNKDYLNNQRAIDIIAVPPGKKLLLDYYMPSGAALVHEYMHAVFGATDVRLRGDIHPTASNDTTTTPTMGKIAYGHENVLRLAQEQPNGARKARHNADSYRVFAGLVTMGGVWAEQWGINPDNLVEGMGVRSVGETWVGHENEHRKGREQGCGFWEGFWC